MKRLPEHSPKAAPRHKYLPLIVALVFLAALIGAVVLIHYHQTHPRAEKPAASVTESPAAEDSAPGDVPAASVSDESVEETEDGTFPAPEYPTVRLDVPTVQAEDFQLRVEAEEAVYTGKIEMEDLHPGASGDGYLVGFSGGSSDTVKARFTRPTAQHYDITVAVYAESPVTNALTVGGTRIGTFSISEEETERFVRVTFPGIYLKKGDASVAVEVMDGGIAVDYLEVTDHKELAALNYQGSYTPCDPKASAGAKKLMAFLAENYGSKVLTGQHTAGADDTELELIRRLTGKLPAIRFGDVESYTENSTAKAGDVIGASLDWAEQGGIVGLMWHWDAPTGISSVYAEETDFSLKDALPPYNVTNVVVEPELPDEMEHDDDQVDPDDTSTKKKKKTAETEAAEPTIVQRYEFSVDVALMDIDEVDKLVKNGTLKADCAALLRDIDAVAETLRPLADADVPVLWRPLHEGAGSWFWWGADGPEPYRWLWDVMYRRMTEYHGLHNLIWVWNGQNADYLVDQYDIASADIYLSPDKEFGSRYEQFLSLYRMTGGSKMLALSECSTVPDMNTMFRDHTIWSYAGLWYGDYLIDADGKYAETYTSSTRMVEFYNSEAALTLEDVQRTFK